jgi:precorrin-6B methylase 2
METAEVRRIIEKLGGSVWTFCALCYAAETGMLEYVSEPRAMSNISERTGVPLVLVERIFDVLVALNLAQREGDTITLDKGLIPLVTPPVKTLFLANLRVHLYESRHLIDSVANPAEVLGWNFTEPVILQAQGIASAIGVDSSLLPRLGDLGLRLEAPSARFLDIGSGVGAISIAACRSLPKLHAVGLEPQEASLDEACRHIAAAGLTERIELRKQRVEDMTDEEAFDLAFFPQMFMPDNIAIQGLQNIWRALRPGGWVLVPTMSVEGMDLQATVSRLRDVLWGGAARTPSRVEAMLTANRFASVGSFGSPAWGTVRVVAGQRPV